MNNFSKLGLSASIIEVLDQLGFENPTPIQEKAIPMLLTQNPTDFIGLAQTGTGKTAAFGLPLIDLIDENNQATQALIMAPTRELGQQTGKQLMDFSRNNKAINIEVVYGGAAIMNQIKALRKPTQIVVATPGRLIDLIKRKAVNLDSVKYVVLDEADEMLNMGFKEDIDTILSHTLDERVTWLFSATMPAEIRRIVKKYMDSPLEVSVNSEEKSNKDITHQYVTTKTGNKIPALRRFLDMQPEMRGIMFCRTKRETQEIADDLSAIGYGVEALHGDLSQAQRDAVMKRFKTRSMQLLIATDVAARGIDVNDLTHVLHHTLPDQLESYTHRSGRTGRAGKKGISLAFINPREGRRIEELERKIKVKFERIEVPTLEALKSNRIHNWANFIINTKVDDQAEAILQDMQGRFADLSKEDLLKRLITTQLDHIMSQSGDSNNLNESAGGPPDQRDKSKFHRYFVNIGSIDGMTNADIIHFLSDVSGVDRKYFGDLSLQKNCAYFDVDSGHDKGMNLKFEGVEIEGRSIRVNRDDDGGLRSKRPSGPKKSYGSGGGGGGRRSARPKKDFGRRSSRRR
ncbi:DEAD/DEAH box helicase [Marinoscillum luteum]|uniref:RNA helicase n=1 Tax=Marinoscillum luteum TaxID=861051 RepID=A0ABW7N3Z3_9BACT